MPGHGYAVLSILSISIGDWDENEVAPSASRESRREVCDEGTEFIVVSDWWCESFSSDSVFSDGSGVELLGGSVLVGSVIWSLQTYPRLIASSMGTRVSHLGHCSLISTSTVAWSAKGTTPSLASSGRMFSVFEAAIRFADAMAFSRVVVVELAVD